MLPIGDVVRLVVGLLALWIGARSLVTGASKLASAAGVSALVIGLTVVAFGTSSPEAVVSTEAALEGRGDIAVGNVIGSNLFNIAVTLGVVAILSPFRVSQTVIRRDALAMAASTAVAAGVLANGTASRLEGAILVALLIGYFGVLGVAIRASNDTGSQDLANTEVDRLPRVGPPDEHTGDELRLGLEMIRVLVGLVLLVVGGRVVIDSAVRVATAVGVSEWVIAATVVAAGTSLPEFVTSVVAARAGDVGIAAGNVIGSNVFNVLGVLGLAAMVRPLAADPAVFLALIWLTVLTAFATAVLATGRRLTRLEGVVLVALGAGYWIVSAVV
ncbi:calcium/sodium antiporter [Natrinema gelatinilyticum]|uniref:calcium/sodium antiporter n=1 Tax=Natrinema gelatinilyticum TaxID=2961571 RepID=UPI0020C406CA|nr:calcium/sodium antiporter [Natrinema gelatinilyticum]